MALAGSSGRPEGVRRPFDGIGSFHLPKQRQHDYRELDHGIIRVSRIHADGVSQVLDTDTPFCQIVIHIQGVAYRPSPTVQWMDHKHVAGPRCARTAVSQGRAVVAPDFLSMWMCSGGIPAAAKAASWRSKHSFAVETHVFQRPCLNRSESLFRSSA